MKDNLQVYAYKLSKADDGEQYHGDIARFENTKELFARWKDILVNKYETFKELTQEVMEGKIAVFPVWENQDTLNIEGHLNYGFDVILLKYREYNKFVEYYKENAVEINKECADITYNKNTKLHNFLSVIAWYEINSWL